MYDIENRIHPQKETMTNNAQDSATMIGYRERLANLEKFNGSEQQKISQFINNIERIGRMIDANDDILHCMCIAKLDGEAKHWYENNMRYSMGTIKTSIIRTVHNTTIVIKNIRTIERTETGTSRINFIILRRNH